MIPLGGVIHTALDWVWKISRRFYGFDCPHFGVECFFENTNKVFMQYGCLSNLGLKMNILMDYMFLEMLISLQPFQASYKRYEQWMTPSCLKSLWEKCDQFDVMVEFKDTPLELPRCGDKWLMRDFLRCGLSVDELRRINIVHIHMQVIFLS